ncbi:MAG: hypothetical protein PT944_01985 [Actinomycetaceae bacterium]|nr:hypothetical protein [Actinomycetaceae bacterium]MDY5273821.1 hypothetical protein [Arcanobacterium sp.]
MANNRTARKRAGKSSQKKALYVALVAVVLVVVAMCSVIYGIYKIRDGVTESGAQGASAQEGNAASADSDDGQAIDLTIAGEPITAGEFRYALAETKSAVVASCGSGEQSIGADFWRANTAMCAPEASTQPRSEAERMQAQLTSSYSPTSKTLCAAATHPLEFALCKAVRLLEQQHAVYQQAVAAGHMHSASWNDVMQNASSENAENERARSKGEAVYGLDRYEVPVYLSKYLSQLKDQYINDDAAPGMAVSDDQVKQHYAENTWDFGSEISAIPSESERWEIIAANVKEDLRSTIYYDLVSARVRNMDIVMNRANLVDFVKSALSS